MIKGKPLKSNMDRFIVVGIKKMQFTDKNFKIQYG